MHVHSFPGPLALGTPVPLWASVLSPVEWEMECLPWVLQQELMR